MVGIGLSGWSGLARFSSPSTSTIMGLDAPLFQQATNDVTDQFLRKLGVFAKGKFNKLDYRISITQPFAFQKSPIYTSIVTKNLIFQVIHHIFSSMDISNINFWIKKVI
ncbi:MAG: hypothetical protein IPN46_11600 [Saprospiraceae bacterium]|nr:hypothetical protein [Saprospiraceae bacterium]